MTLKFFIGVVSFSLSLFAIVLNLLIFIPVFRLAFISKKSTIYIIAFFNIISDLMQLCVTCFQLSASIMADRYILSRDRLDFMNIFLGGVFLNAWYLESLVQIVMAVNRYVVITLGKKNIFTFKTTIIIFVFLISITTFSAICSQFLFPCCLYIADHEAMSYVLVNIKGLYSYSNLMIVLYDIFCTTISSLCYISIFHTIRQKAKVAPANVQSTRSNQDIKYLFQFVFISIFYIFASISFECLSFIVPASQPEWYALVPMFITLNCSSNSIIYLTVNPEVQNILKCPWIKWKKRNVSVGTI